MGTVEDQSNIQQTQKLEIKMFRSFYIQRGSVYSKTVWHLCVCFHHYDFHFLVIASLMMAGCSITKSSKWRFTGCV